MCQLRAHIVASRPAHRNQPRAPVLSTSCPLKAKAEGWVERVLPEPARPQALPECTPGCCKVSRARVCVRAVLSPGEQLASW
jgi:hypothetical protein